MKRSLALAGAGALIVGGAAAFAPSALAQGCPSGDNQCAGSVNASVTIPETLVFTINSPTSFNLTGAPGGATNDASVSWTIATNDGVGWSVGVTSAGDLAASPSNGHTIPSSDLFVDPSSYDSSGANPDTNGTNDWTHALPLSNTASDTTNTGGTPTAGFTALDYYAIPGTTPTGATGTGSPTGSGAVVPAVPPATYGTVLDYLGVGN